MSSVHNPFKQALKEGRPQIGLWLALASPVTAELCGGAGFDWLLIDGEHAPNDIPMMMAQLQALAASPSHPIVRIPIGDSTLIKQVLDIGAQTVLVPMVESGTQANMLARAMRYPPQGMRGVGAVLGRVSDYGRIADYVTRANDEVCLLLQIESRAGLAAIDDIAGTDGVDGVFIGPADLAADMGHLGNPDAPEVKAAVEEAIARILSHGKAAGILTGDKGFARRCLELGATFVAVGHDVGLLGGAAADLASEFTADGAKRAPTRYA